MKKQIKTAIVCIFLVHTLSHFNTCYAQSFTASILDTYDNINHCDGFGVYLTADPMDITQYTYQWTCPNGSCPNMWNENGPFASFFPDYNSPNIGEYTVLITEIATGDTASATVSVSTYPNPVVLYTNNPNGCEGQQIYIHASDFMNNYPPYTYQWDGGSPTSADSIAFTFGPDFSFAPDVMITNGFGCSSVNSSIFWMIGSPTPQATISSVGPTAFCAGDSVKLLAEGTHPAYTLQNVTYQWRKFGNNLNDTDSIYFAKSSAKYRCIVSASGCADTSNFINVVVNPLPSVALSPPVQTGYCLGQSATLVATSPTAISYQWKRNSVFINNQTNDSLTVNIGGKYKAVVTDANGCSRTSAPVQVYGPPNNQVVVTGSLSFCNGDSVIFTAAPGNFYQWRRNNVNIAAPEGLAQSYTATTAGNYKVMVSNAFGCTVASATKQVTVPCRIANPYFAEQNIEAYPNPFSENIIIKIPLVNGTIPEVMLFDLNGRLVYEFNAAISDNSEINVFTGDLEGGMYLLQVRTADEVFKQIVVKQ